MPKSVKGKPSIKHQGSQKAKIKPHKGNRDNKQDNKLNKTETIDNICYPHPAYRSVGIKPQDRSIYKAA